MITLATLKDATAQEVYDQVKNHLLNQNAKSTDYKGNCKYRGDDGFKCAAGCLMSDEEYEPEFDEALGVSWICLSERRKAPKEHSDLIQALQTIHDKSEVHEWPSKLTELALEFELTP